MNEDKLRNFVRNIELLLEELKSELSIEKSEHVELEKNINSSDKKYTGTKNSSDFILLIVNKIGDCEESEQLKSKILDVRNQEAKLLLCFFISYKYFSNQWLNSGDIEKITSELGVKIDKRNITNKLKEIRQYLESGATRKKGQATPYRLNRKGVTRFGEILNAKKIK